MAAAICGAWNAVATTWRKSSAMPSHSIDYLNARRAAIQAGHARPQPRADRVLNVAARKLRDAEMAGRKQTVWNDKDSSQKELQLALAFWNQYHSPGSRNRVRAAIAYYRKWNKQRDTSLA